MSLALAHFASSLVQMQPFSNCETYPNNVFKKYSKFEQQLGTRNFKQYELSACKIVKKFAKFAKF
jgi:hypothetical protein